MDYSQSVTLQEIFGIILRQHRETNGLSQEHLAHAAGLDRTFISLIERGKRQPSLTTLFALCMVLEVAPEQLIAEVSKRFDKEQKNSSN